MHPADVREQLISTLALDLVGPTTPSDPHATELLPERPTSWYLTGFLVPFEASAAERAGDDIGDETEVHGKTGTDDETPSDAPSGRRAFFPSSMGLSTLVRGDVHTLHVRATWGDYELLPGEPHGRADKVWQRHPRQAELTVDLRTPAGPLRLAPADGSKPLDLVLAQREVPEKAGLPPGTCVVSLFVVNNRPPSPKGTPRDLACAFQVVLEVRSPEPFVPRPDRRGKDGKDPDESIAELQYRDVVEHAVGHNVAVHATLDADGHCRHVQTVWMPCAEVEKVVATRIPGVSLGMETLAAAASAAELQAMLRPMVTHYEDWIGKQPTAFDDATRAQTARDLIAQAQVVRKRISRGIDLLADPQVFYAFQLANKAVATALRQRSSHESDTAPKDFDEPEWRPFQLAFILLNLVGIVHPTHTDRGIVDLLFFPTGGGKTEAYLGLAAFTLVLRRLRNPGLSSAGVTVLMRYTLRLLTLDQLGRAATLICALELERVKQPDRLAHGRCRAHVAGGRRGGGLHGPGGQPGRPLHDPPRLLQLAARARRQPPHRGGRGQVAAARSEPAPARGTDAGPIRQSVHRRPPTRADLAYPYQRAVGHQAPAQAAFPREAPRRCRAGHQHDLGGPRHHAPGAHGRARTAQERVGVHPGHQPRGPRRPAPGLGGHPAQRAQAP